MRDGLRVGLPNGTSIQATHTGLLPADGPVAPLFTDACRVSLFTGLTSKSLISTVHFFDDGYSTVFTSHTARLVKENASTVVGHRNRSQGLWDIAITAWNPSSNPPFPQAHVNTDYKMKALEDLIIYLHRTCFSPVVSTWTKAINAGYFNTWPGLTSALMHNYLP